MPKNSEILEHYQVDPFTYVITLEVPASKIVLLQAYFESYEGLGLVRTALRASCLITVYTTPSMFDDCQALLYDILPEICWRVCPTKPEYLL